MMSLLYVVRHGQAAFGSDHYDQLSEYGEQQARWLGEYWGQKKLALDALYTGSLQRQKETARLMREEVLGHNVSWPEPQIREAFNEYQSIPIVSALTREKLGLAPDAPIDWNTAFSSPKAFQHFYEEILLRWTTGELDHLAQESWPAFQQRVISGLEQVCRGHRPHQTIVVVTSGGPISAIAQQVLGVSNEQTMRLCWQTFNTSVTPFIFRDDRITMVAFNTLPHLATRADSWVTRR